MGRNLNRRLSSVIGLALIAALLPLGGAASAVGIAPKTGVLFGAQVNGRWGLYQGPAVRKFETIIGRKFAISNRFYDFSQRDYKTEATMASGNRIPMISWRAIDGKKNPDPNRAMKIARGDFDANIKATADAVKALKAPILIRFAWEMTQGPGKPQNIGGPADFIAAWRHIVRIFRVKGVTNARFVWAPQAAAFCSGKAQLFFPGDDWVNWIGGSAVPEDNWRSYGDLFRCFYNWGSAHPKPLLTWVGVKERPGDPGWKANFLRGARTTIKNSMPKLKAFIYFNSINGSSNFWSDTSSGAFNAYKAMGCDPYFEARMGCN